MAQLEDHDAGPNEYPHQLDNPAFSNEGMITGWREDKAPKHINIGGVNYTRTDMRDRYKVPFLVVISTLGALVAIAMLAGA